MHNRMVNLFYFSYFLSIPVFSFIKICIFMLLTGKDRDVGEVLVKSLQNTKYSIDEKLENSFINLFGQKPKVSAEALADTQGINKNVEQDGKIVTLDAVEAGIAGETNSEMDWEGSESSDQDEADAMTESEASGSDDEDGDATDSNATPEDHLKEHIEFHDGRQRRRVIFGSDLNQNNLTVRLKLLCLSNWNHASVMLTRKKLACFMAIAFEFFLDFTYLGSAFNLL